MANQCAKKPVPGEWSWIQTPHGGQHRLITPTGLEAANIYMTVPGRVVWYVCRPDGIQGQNDIGRGRTDEDKLRDAKWSAEHAAKVLWYENGWVDPLPGLHPGSRVRTSGDHPRQQDIGYVLMVTDSQYLVCTLPASTPLWKYAVPGLYSPDQLESLPPIDPDTGEPEGDWEPHGEEAESQ